MGVRWHLRSAAVAAAIVAGAGTPARAQERDDARAAYDDAAQAYEARDFPRAARGFARADALAPNALALKLALAAAVQAEEPVLAEELAIRAEGRDTSPDVQELARTAHRLARGRVGRLRVGCASPSGCAAEVAGRRLRDGETVLVARGPVDVTFISGGGRTALARVDVAAGGTTLANEPPAVLEGTPRAEPAPPLRGLSPAVFWIGVVTTAVVAGATIASGIDADARYDDFAALRTREARDAGQASELRTNVLLGASAVIALATGAIGLWFTRWDGHGGSERRP